MQRPEPQRQALQLQGPPQEQAVVQWVPGLAPLGRPPGEPLEQPLGQPGPAGLGLGRPGAERQLAQEEEPQGRPDQTELPHVRLPA